MPPAGYIKLPEHDIASRGLDAYIHNLVNNATEEQLSLIPTSVISRYIRGDHRNRKVRFFEKLVTLVRAFKKEVYIIIGDYENGLTPEKFIEWRKAEMESEYTEKNAKELLESGMFVLGSEDVCQGLMFNRMLGASGIFKYLARYSIGKIFDTKEAMYDVSKMLLHYEQMKRRMLFELKMTIADWYVLLYFGDGVEKKAAGLYVGQSMIDAGDEKRMIRGLKNLTETGHLKKTGTHKSTTYRITALGIDLLNRALSKYVVNY